MPSMAEAALCHLLSPADYKGKRDGGGSLPSQGLQAAASGESVLLDHQHVPGMPLACLSLPHP